MKKILRLLKCKNNGGFTLIEVIVSCALLAVLILAVVGMITPVMSVIGNNEKNANALMIAEAVEAHIDRNIKNSVFCGVFTNAGGGSTVVGTPSTDLTGSTGKIQASDAFKEMLTFLSTDNNKDIYDMKIIGIRWLEDTRVHQYKYMLTNITPKLSDDGSSVTSFTEGKVFEDCFFENMYPEVKFETVEHIEYEADGTTKKWARNVALNTTINVYTRPEMGSSLAASGMGYADFINIRTNAINRDGTYKLYWINGSTDGMGAAVTVKTELREDSDFTAEFGAAAHPETYIIYVTRKLKFAAPTTTP